MTSGVAYEAMNQAGHYLPANMIIVLNDNEMSISRNVGGISLYLSRIRLSKAYTRMRSELEEGLKTIPGVGKRIFSVFSYLKKAITNAMVPGVLFEELGIKYIGPIDGHNIAQIDETLRGAKRLEGPVLIHVITQKGKGYGPAEARPDAYHGISPFDPKTGKVISGKGGRNFTEVFGEKMVEIGARDEDVIAITAAMKLGTGLSEFAEKYPERFIDVGIAEQLAVNLAAGLALGGKKPVVAVYSTFLQRALDQLCQEVCLQKLPVVFAVDRAGLVGNDGATHHGYFDISYLRMLPEMTVMAPKDGRELENMLDYALSLGTPAAVRFPRGRDEPVMPEKNDPIEIGRGQVLVDGEQVCLAALGRMVGLALRARDVLEDLGVSTSVVNARFAKPLDIDFWSEVTADYDLVVTLEENTRVGGFGDALFEALSDAGIDVSLVRIGLPDRFIDHGDTEMLLKEVGLTPEGVAEKISSLLEG